MSGDSLVLQSPGTARVGAAEGWAAAFETFYEERYAATVRLAFLLVGRWDVAEELTQDAFVALGERWQSVQVPVAYLRRAVVNSCTRHRRRARREEEYVASQRPPVEAPPDVSDMWRALRIVAPRRRAAIVLRFWLDWDDVAISEVLGCRPATVRQLVRRGLEELRGGLR